MKIVKRLSGLAAIRRRLGLNQEQLANQLHVHRSTIKLVEQGKRSLPTAALMLVANMEILLDSETQHTKYETIHPAEHNAVTTFRMSYDMLFARGSKCRLNSYELAKKLEMMTGLYQKTRAWLTVIELSVKENHPDQITAESWKKQQQHAFKTLNKCALPMQVLLKCRIAILDAEAELYNNIKQQLNIELHEFFNVDKKQNSNGDNTQT